MEIARHNGQIHNIAPTDLRPLEPLESAASDDIAKSVERARAAQPRWQATSLDDRVRALRAAAKRILERRGEAIELMRDEVGKLEVDALMSEVLGPLDQVNAWAKVVKKNTATERVRLNPLQFPKKSAQVDMVPRGVIGIIAPWNYPVATFYRSVFPALLTGNAVVFKASEYCPRVAQWMGEQLSQDLPEGLLTVLVGGGDVGQKLVEGGIDACVFTGSHSTGKKVAVACAERLIPVSVELGGNDAAVVLADCDLERTCAGVTHWALHNVGQACGAIEIAYVDERIADAFVDRMRRAWVRLRTGPGPFSEVDISPLSNERQLATVERHVEDARAKGAKVLVGGRKVGEGLWYLPTLLDHCTDDMDVVADETFGPVLAIVRVSGAEEALRRVNASRYGLGVSVWTSDFSRAERLAERFDTGVVNINNHALTGAIPQVPWSGTKDTGFGIANSKYALTTFMRPRTTLVDKNEDPDLFWLPYDRNLYNMGDILSDVLLGRVERAWKLPMIMRRRLKRIRRFFR